MKIVIDIECSPQEARAFFGLPDLSPLHDIYLDRLKSFINDSLSPADFERMTRTWMPSVGEGLETWRQMILRAGQAKSE